MIKELEFRVNDMHGKYRRRFHQEERICYLFLVEEMDDLR